MGEGVLYNLVFTEWRHCVSQHEVWRRGCYMTLFSPSDVTAFHRMKYGGGGVIWPCFHRVTSLRFTEWSMEEGVLYDLVFTEWRYCVSQNEVWGRGCYITLFSPSDVTAFHRILVQVRIYRRLLVGRDGHFDQSEAYEVFKWNGIIQRYKGYDQMNIIMLSEMARDLFNFNSKLSQYFPSNTTRTDTEEMPVLNLLNHCAENMHP